MNEILENSTLAELHYKKCKRFFFKPKGAKTRWKSGATERNEDHHGKYVK